MAPDHPDALILTAALRDRFIEFYQGFTPMKKASGGWRGPCPLHGGDGPNFSVDPETGHWYCHSQCQEGGDIFTFVQKREGINFGEALERVAVWAGGNPGSSFQFSQNNVAPQTLTPARNPNTYLNPALVQKLHEDLLSKPKILEWLLSHRGLTVETITRFRLGLERPIRRGDLWRITFPIYDAHGQLANIRRHLFQYKQNLDRAAMGKTLAWEKGLRAELFPHSVLDGAEDVLLVEGESDAALGNQNGIPTVTGTLGAATWKPEWTESLRGKRSVTVLYDSDTAGQAGAHKAAISLVGAVTQVRIARLPEGKGKDLTDYVVQHGATAEDIQRVIAEAQPFGPLESAIPASQPLVPVQTQAKSNEQRKLLDRLISKPMAERVIDLADVKPPGDLPLLFDHYLLKGAAHWLTGQTGLGKSTWAYNVACALAEGKPLWGIQCEQQHVLYVDMESGDVGRALKLARLYRDETRVRGQLLFLREPLHLPGELGELIKYVAEKEISLVIFDTARRVFAVRDENDNAEVYRQVVPVLDALKAMGVATLTMGHPSKNGGSGARGAGAQEDAGDVNLSLTMHKGEVSDPKGVIVLRVTKNRLLGYVPPLYLRRTGEDQFQRVIAEEGDQLEEREIAPTAGDLIEQDVIGFLSGCPEPIRFTDILREMEKRGHKEGTSKRIITRLQKEGHIENNGEGYVLPPTPDE